jgi:hypothetical protein
LIETQEKSSKSLNVTHDNAPSNGTLVVSPETVEEDTEHDEGK